MTTMLSLASLRMVFICVSRTGQRPFLQRSVVAPGQVTLRELSPFSYRGPETAHRFQHLGAVCYTPLACRQCRRNDATEFAHADMTLPKVDTNCTAPSLMPTIIGNTVRSFSTHGHLSAASERKLVHVSRSEHPFNLNFLIRLCGLMVRKWRLFELFPYPI
jgi:hypothetical protein